MQAVVGGRAMRETFTQLYVHLVWATWDRTPWLKGEIRDAVYDCIQQECTQQGASLLALGGIEDHVHLLVRYPPKISISDLIKQIKGVSSHMVTHKMGYKEGFKWQGAYAAFTCSHEELSLSKTISSIRKNITEMARQTRTTNWTRKQNRGVGEGRRWAFLGAVSTAGPPR